MPFVFQLSLASGGGALLVSTLVYVLFNLVGDLKEVAVYAGLASAVLTIVVVQIWGGFRLVRQR